MILFVCRSVCLSVWLSGCLISFVWSVLCCICLSVCLYDLMCCVLCVLCGVVRIEWIRDYPCIHPSISIGALSNEQDED